MSSSAPSTPPRATKPVAPNAPARKKKQSHVFSGTGTNLSESGAYGDQLPTAGGRRRRRRKSKRKSRKKSHKKRRTKKRRKSRKKKSKRRRRR